MKTIVTISRLCGSGGSYVGEKIAQKLGVDFYNRNLLRLASDDSGISEALFAKCDEKIKSSLLYKVAKKVYNGELIQPESGNFTSDRNLFNYQAKIIKGLAENESMVVVGRCADFVLRDNPDCIKVFVTSSEKVCAKRIAQRDGVSLKEATVRVAKTNRQRGDYYKFYTGQEFSHAGNYDLCISTDVLSYDECADLIIEFINKRQEKIK